jgi:hypothetical protein
MEKSSRTCIVSVAFREPYVTHSRKQREAIKDDVDFIYFIDELPAKDIVHTDDIISEFQKSLYGFKPHAIQHAIDKGYKKVIWLDPSVLPLSPMQVLIDSLDEHPMIIRSGDNPLSKMTNDKAKQYFGVTNKELENVNHIGGTIYGFNFNRTEIINLFEVWKLSEENGIFGNQDEFIAGHWADESCMALSMYKMEIGQYTEDNFKYKNQKND